MSVPLKVEPLPWAPDALAPVMSGASVRAHRVLERRYVAAVNEQLQFGWGDVLQEYGLPVLVKEAQRHGAPLFESAAQAFNHRFFWSSLSPDPRSPTGTLQALLARAFGSHAGMVDSAERSASQVFGSGWLWLVCLPEGLVWWPTLNADLPDPWYDGTATLLLCVDLWEHAYYLDSTPRSVEGPSARVRYLRNLLRTRMNWRFAETNLRSAGSVRMPI